MSNELPNLLSAGEIPQSNRVVHCDRNKLLAIWRKSNFGDNGISRMQHKQN
jgi:hypothetical protein